MLESITWKQFIIAVTASLFIWYVAVILLYYRSELMEFLKGAGRRTKTAESANSAQEIDFETEGPGSFDELEQKVGEIHHSILEKAGREATKDELLRQISDSVANYSGLRRPAFRIALNNFIIQHAESICGVTFSEEELEEAWEALPR